MPSWLTRTTVPPLLTGKKRRVRSNLPAAEHREGRGGRTLLVTVEINDLLQTNRHSVIPVDAEGQIRHTV